MLIVAELSPTTRPSRFQIIKGRRVVWFYFSLYYKIHGEQYGDQKKTALADRLLELAEGRTDTRVDVSDGRCTVAIVTPLMARVHQLREAGETVFVDAGGELRPFTGADLPGDDVRRRGRPSPRRHHHQRRGTGHAGERLFAAEVHAAGG